MFDSDLNSWISSRHLVWIGNWKGRWRNVSFHHLYYYYLFFFFVFFLSASITAFRLSFSGWCLAIVTCAKYTDWLYYMNCYMPEALWWITYSTSTQYLSNSSIVRRHKHRIENCQAKKTKKKKKIWSSYHLFAIIVKFILYIYMYIFFFLSSFSTLQTLHNCDRQFFFACVKSVIT